MKKIGLLAFLALLTTSSAQELSSTCRQLLASKSGIFQGKDNYFFYADELSGNWIAKPLNQSVNTIEYFKTINDELKEKNIRLILMPIPPRPLTLGSKVNYTPDDKKYDINLQIEQYNEFIKNLRDSHLNVVDVLKVLANSNNVYFTKDIHWTPEGARLTAKAAANFIKTTPEYYSTTKSDYITQLLESQNKPITSQYAVSYLRDLCNINISTDKTNIYKTAKLEEGFANFSQISDVEDGSHRWVYGPSAKVSFISPAEIIGHLKLKISLFFDNQSIRFLFNNQLIHVETAKILNPDSRIRTIDIKLKILKGVNTLSIMADKYNYGTSKIIKDDRPLAFDINDMTLALPDGTEFNAISKKDDSGDSLLDDTNPPIALIGSSYSDPSFNLSGFLQQYTRLDTINLSTGGGGVFDSMRSIVQGSYLNDSPPKYLIWEFPMFGNVVSSFNDFLPITGAIHGCDRGVANSIAVKVSHGKAILPSYNNPNAKIIHFKLPQEATSIKLYSKDSSKWNIILTNSLRVESREHMYLPLEGKNFNLKDKSEIDLGQDLNSMLSVEYCK